MNIGKNIILISLLICCTCWRAMSFAPNLMTGDTIDCIVDFELGELENGDFVVSMIPDTTWEFPLNLVSTAQVTLKAPKGQLEIGEINNLVENVIFFIIGTDEQPVEAPNFDYVSIALGSQGTAGISFTKGEKVDLFSFNNVQACNNGVISLMDNFTDPFFPPNEKSANVGQQLTVAGFNLADVPIGIRGTGIACSDTGGTSALGVQIAKQDISCFGQNDGVIVAKGNGGSSPYTYLWSTGSTLSTIDMLSAGDYTLTLTDSNDSTVIRNITITEPPLFSLTINKTDATGAMVADGTASPSLMGGTPPYQFRWNNGSTDALQSDLLPGVYALVVKDANACEILQTVTIGFQDCPVIDVMLDMQSPDCAGDSTGALRIFPMSGEAPYTFLWETGETAAILNNIPSGNYMVTVTDANGCTMAVSGFLADALPITIDLVSEVGAEMGTGSITSTVSGGMMPYTYIWSNGSDTPNLTNLESGVYNLIITDVNDCIQTASVVIAEPACSIGLLDNFGQNLMMDTISCFSEGELCLPIPLDSMVNFSLFLDGESYMDRITGCQFDTLYAYSYFTLLGQGGFGPYILDEWTINGQNFTGTFQDINALVDSMNTWDPVGNWLLDSDILIIQGGLPSNQYEEMTIRTPATNSLTTLDLNTNLTPIGTLITFATGSHELILVDKNTTCSDTLSINQPCSDSISRDTLIIREIVEGRSTVFPLTEFFGDNLVISENQCPELLDGNVQISLDRVTSELTVTGIMEGSDDICYSIMDENGMNIQFVFRVNVSPVPENCLSFIEMDTFAIEVAGCQVFEICTPLIYDSLLTYGITDNGNPFSGVGAACDSGNGSLLTFTTPRTHQLIFTNSENCQDTLILTINAPDCDEDLVIRDTVEVNEDGRTCIELTGLSSPYHSVQDLCPEQNGEMAMLTIDGVTGCIDYTGVELGVDTACIEICDVFGFCDTVSFIIIVTNGAVPPPDFQATNDTVQTSINEPIVFNALGNDFFNMLDTMYLVGMPSNGMATFNLDGTISYTPNMDFCDDINPDTFQYAICEGGICDTATVRISVPCMEIMPLDAVDDTARTSINSDIIFNALGNDVFTTLDDMFLVGSVDNGVAFFNLDGTIRYVPATDYCNDTIPDIFQYAICEGSICDTATVIIFVDCTSERNFTIYNALSPNGDGINDVFQIDGIEDFPENTVQIFNRWGNMVYEMAGYKNEWNGNWGRDNSLLPDGTYFYLFDTGEGEQYSGFLEIRR